MFEAVESEDVVVEDEVHEQLVFRIGEMLLAIPVLGVREILDRTPFLALPRTPPYVLGMVDVRSRSIAVIDFAQKLGAGPMSTHEGSRIVVLEFASATDAREPVSDGGADSARLIAILTDGVVGVTALEESEDQSIPPMGEPWDTQFMTSLGRLASGELVIRIDLEALFTDEDQRLFASSGVTLSI